MIHMDFDPVQLTGEQKDWWDAWSKRADRATINAIEAWEESGGTTNIPWDSSVWADLKAWLLKNVFHDKCAYCETKIVRFYGDAEHYRPKGGVKYVMPGSNKQAIAQVTDEAGNLRDHPGYFWLAYHWRNLVPACQCCNSGKGKQNQFPVKNYHVLWKKCTPAEVNQLRDKPYPRAEGSDQYYLGPLDLDAEEQPLLLHPYRDRAQEHIGFERGGHVVHLSDLGKDSIEVYNLEDANLANSRSLAQMGAKTLCDARYNYCLQWEELPEQDAWRKTMDGIWDKLQPRPYAAAGYDYILKYCKPACVS
jgi:hypothetical protein